MRLGVAMIEHHETQDGYRGEVFRHGRFRVIVCKDGIQWILPRKKGGAGRRWQALGYFTTRVALSRLWTASTGETVPEIACLPETVRGDRTNKRPSPRVIQARRIRWKFGLSERQARLIADLRYGDVR